MSLKGGGGGNAVRAGGVFVELSARASSLYAALDSARARMQAFGQSVTTIGAGAAGAGAGLLAPLTALFAASTDRADTLGLLATQLGTTVENVSRLGYAFETVGVKQEDFVDITKTLQQQLSAAADGQDETFRRLGLNARELIDMPIDEQLTTIAGAINNITTAADKSNFALKVFGGQGQKALRLLSDGNGLAKLAAESDAVGATVSGDMATNAREIKRAWDSTYAAVKFAVLEIGNAILPQAGNISEFADSIKSAARVVRGWISENKMLVLGIAGVGAALAVGGSALAGFGVAVTGLSFAFSGLLAVLGLVKGAIFALLSPVGAVVAILGTLGYLFVTQTETGKELAGSLVGTLGEAFRELAAIATAAWDGISSALARGDLATAGKIALAGLEVVFRQAMVRITELWQSSSGGLVDIFSSVIVAIQNLWTNVTSFIQKKFTSMLSSLLGRAAKIASFIGADSLSESLQGFADASDVATREIERERAETIAKRKQALADEIAARKDAGEQEVEKAKLALTAAQRAFADMLADEEFASAIAKLKLDEDEKVAKAKRGAQSALAQSVKGVFTARDFRQVFAAGDSVAERALGAQLDANKKLDAIKDAIEENGPEFE